MIARFRISEDDYAAAMKLFVRLARTRRVLLIAIVAVLALGALLGGRTLWPVVLVGFVGVGIIVMPIALAPTVARRHYRQYKGMQEAFGAELLDHGLRIESLHGEGTIVWENILQWRQNDRFVLVYVMPRLFHVLPKSVVEQGFDMPALIERLGRQVGPEA
jgi:hypothetical protein